MAGPWKPGPSFLTTIISSLTVESPLRSLTPFLTHLHADTARDLNQAQSESDRQVWFNFWETELTYEKSYLARLAYVHQNPVRHGLVAMANQYRWCSAAWFERTATAAQVKTIYGFKIDRVTVRDDYDVALADVA